MRVSIPQGSASDEWPTVERTAVAADQSRPRINSEKLVLLLQRVRRVSEVSCVFVKGPQTIYNELGTEKHLPPFVLARQGDTYAGTTIAVHVGNNSSWNAVISNLLLLGTLRKPE